MAQCPDGGWCPSGVHTGANIIFARDTDSAIECTLRNFADDTRLKLSGVTDTLEQRGTIHRDLDTLKSFICVTLKNFDEANWKAPNLTWGNPKHG